MNTCLVERSGNLVSNSPEKVEATAVSIANHVILFLNVTVIIFFVDLCSHMNDQIPPPTDPEGFTKNYVGCLQKMTLTRMTPMIIQLLIYLLYMNQYLHHKLCPMLPQKVAWKCLPRL